MLKVAVGLDLSAPATPPHVQPGAEESEHCTMSVIVSGFGAVHV